MEKTIVTDSHHVGINVHSLRLGTPSFCRRENGRHEEFVSYVTTFAGTPSPFSQKNKTKISNFFDLSVRHQSCLGLKQKSFFHVLFLITTTTLQT